MVNVISVKKPVRKIANLSPAHQKPTPQNKPHKFKKILIIGLMFGGIFLYSPASEYITFIDSRNSASSDINDIADNSGFNYKGMVLFYKAQPELVNADTINTMCPNSDETIVEYGCYLPNENKIYILEVTDSNYKEIEYTSAAHETLHEAWYALNDSEIADLSKKINDFYNDANNTAALKLHETIQPYGEDQDVIINELHSFIGSEVSSSDISQSLDDYYSKYFNNRNATVDANINFQTKIDTESAELSAEYDRLNTSFNEISDFKAEWLDKIESYMNTNLYYGDITTYNKNVAAYNNNLKIYNTKVDTYNADRETYNAKVASFNSVIKAFYPTKTLMNTQ